MSGLIGKAGTSSGVIPHGSIDYEEGFYSYSITGHGGGTWTIRSGYQTLAYTRIGKLVHVTGKFETTGSISGSKSGVLKLSLPFACGNTENASGNAAGVASMRRGSNTIVSTPIAIVWQGDSHLSWQVPILNGSGETYIQADDVDAAIEGEVGITYFTA